MGTALFVIGLLAFLACIVLLIISLIRKKPYKRWGLGMIISLVVFIIGISAMGGGEPESSQVIDYEVLRQWNIPAGGIGMELLVSEDATKEEVLALASSLRSKHLSKGHINISIFDSQEAYNRVDDPTYPEEEFLKHQLVSIARNPTTGYDKIQWIAEGRNY